MAKTTFFEYLQNTEDAISSGRINDAMAICQHILSYFPDALDAQRLLGEIYLAQGQLEEAQQTFDWILVNDPENVVVYCDRALTSERLSDIDTALDCHQQAYELSRGNSQIRQKFNQLSSKVGQQEFMFSRAGLARLYMRGDLLAQAEQEWEAVLNASPERLDARTGLKALLLIAHVTSTFNLDRSKELLLRAETLDPELVMAQELFSDLIASQPNNPFFTMLKKEPILFSDSTGDVEVSNNQTAMNPMSTSNGSESFAEPETHVYSPGNLETWRELDTMQSPLIDIKPAEALSAFASQTEISNVQQSNAITANGHTSRSETDLDQIKSSHAFDNDFDTAILEKQPWFQAEQLQATHSEQDTTNVLSSNVEPAESIHSWSSETQEEDFPTPPAWLDVLTKFDWQPGDPVSTSSTRSQEIEASHENVTSSQTQAEPEPASPKLWEGDLNARPEAYVAEEPAFFFPTEESNSEMEWPEWLKSLGAETLETQTEPATATVDLEPEQSFEFQSWTEQLDQTFAEAEHEQMASLEHLDNDLLSQGFVPLQPGTLNTIAEEPSLSSALAELGNFSADSVTPEPPSTQVTSDTFLQPAESSEPASPPPILADTIPLETPIQNPVAVVAASQTFTPVDNSAEKEAQEVPLIPAYRADALLEDDVETTMKRA